MPLLLMCFLQMLAAKYPSIQVKHAAMDLKEVAIDNVTVANLAVLLA